MRVKKYLCVPSTVTSASDFQRHWIASRDLPCLYGVCEGECDFLRANPTWPDVEHLLGKKRTVLIPKCYYREYEHVPQPVTLTREFLERTLVFAQRD